MSTYVMSDIHGNYKGYKAMLGQIKFTDSDMLYVVGNNHIAIDCASGYPDGRLGCLRLDDMKEFYV